MRERLKRQRGPADHLFQRAGVWQVKLQNSTGGKRVEKSLQTRDKNLALLRARPLIDAHIESLMARATHKTSWRFDYEPGRAHMVDGHVIVAGERELTVYGTDGAKLETRPNGRPMATLAERPYTAEMLNQVADELEGTRAPAPPVKDGDDALMDEYLAARGIRGRSYAEALQVLALYKSVVGVPFAKAKWDDGRKFAKHLEDLGNKSATVKKKAMWLGACINWAIQRDKLDLIKNPFNGVAEEKGDSVRRLPLFDDDTAKLGKYLGGMKESTDALLLRVLATTGMRLSEAFKIKEEFSEKGIRYAMFIEETKTSPSKRRVPFPADLLPYLPKKITGQLFPLLPATGKLSAIEASAAAASKRLNRALRKAGIDDKRKVVHSLRHRAQDRLREAACPQDVRWQLLGHETGTVAEGYGEGLPVRILKEWIDRIGM